MDRSLPTRLLLVLLAGLLQLAAMPATGRAACALRSGSLSLCCCVGAAAPGVKGLAPAANETAEIESANGASTTARPACCRASDVRVDDARGTASTSAGCTCGRGEIDLQLARELPGVGKVADGAARGDRDDPPADMAAITWDSSPRSTRTVGARGLVPRVPPIARTGPPLHLLLQVFLI